MNSRKKIKFFKQLIFIILALVLLVQGPLGTASIYALELPQGRTSNERGSFDENEDMTYPPFYDEGEYDNDYDATYPPLVDENNDAESDLPIEGDGDYDDELEAEIEIERAIEGLSSSQITTVRETGVTRRTATFRRGPGTGYATIRSIRGNTNVRITGRNGDWYRVVIDGTTGWLRRTSVARTRQIAVVTTDNAHVRSGRGSSYTSLTRLPRGHRVTVTRRTGDWSRVTANGHTGWIRNSDLRTGDAMRPGRTTGNNVPVYSRPRTDSEIRERLPRHTNLMIIQRTESSDGWTQIRISHNGGTLNGWVRTSQIETRAYNRRTNRNGALRTGPGSGFQSIRTVPSNTTVTVRSRVGNWYHVHYSLNGNRQYGWLSRDNFARVSLGSNIVGDAGLNPTWGVTYGRAQLRRGAGTNHDVIKNIADATLIANIRRRSGVWLEVTYSGQTGWIHHDSIRIETHTPVVRTNSGRTNTATDLRNGAGNSYSVIRRLNNNSNVTVLRQSGAWLRIRAGNDEGWVREYHVNSTSAATTNISAQLRSGPGNSYSRTRRLPSGINVTILRQRGQWLNISVEGQTDWIHMLYVNMRSFEASVPNVTNRLDSQVNTVNVSNETGLRLVVPRRRTIGVGNAFDVLEGVRVEHVASNGTVTRLPLTWHDSSWTWRFTHDNTTFTVAIEGIMDNLTPGTYERAVTVSRGNAVRARGSQTVVVR